MNLHRIDLVSLSLFNLVARTGSISQGAALGMLAVGAASKRIADLEVAFGVPLLERHSRGVKLTPAGQALHRHVQRILGDVDQMSADLSDHAKGLMGVVRLWANTSAITQFLPGDLADFTRQQPGIRIELNEADSSEVVLAILDGRADVGIFADRTPALGLQTLPYRRDRLVLVVPSGHPMAALPAVDFSDTLELDHVGLHEASAIHAFLRQICSGLHRNMRQRIQVSSFEVACRMIEATVGVGVLPESAARRHAQTMAINIVPLSDDWSLREMHVCVRSMEALPAFARDLVTLLIEDSRNAPEPPSQVT